MQKWVVDYLHTKKIYDLKCEYCKLTILSKNIYLFFLNFSLQIVIMWCHSKSSKIKGIRIIELKIVSTKKVFWESGVPITYIIHGTITDAQWDFWRKFFSFCYLHIKIPPLPTKLSIIGQNISLGSWCLCKKSPCSAQDLGIWKELESKVPLCDSPFLWNPQENLVHSPYTRPSNPPTIQLSYVIIVWCWY